MDAFISSPNVPLFCIGDVVQGNWPKELNLTGSRIFSYVLNNYWNTNYKASQGGQVSFSYSITSKESISKEEAYRLGWESRQPLYSHRISFQDFRDTKKPYDKNDKGTLATIDSQKVIISTIKKGKWKKGWIVRLQEISGDNAKVTVKINGKYIKGAWKTDLLEKDIQKMNVNNDGSLSIEVVGWGLTTIRIVF